LSPRTTTPRSHRSALLLIPVLALVAALAVALQEDAAPYSAYAGGRTYATYCSNCHGAGGQGDGYIATELKTKPADLTRIAARNDGVFPAERVAETIDGQQQVKLHGRREMPIWGDVFLWPEGDTPERREVVKQKIGELVEYLRSIQVESAAD